MKFGECIRNIVVLPVNLANPVHRSYPEIWVAGRWRSVHHLPMNIRDATPEDGPAACEVMRRSIAVLCVADHRNDPAILGRWLSNKTPEMFRSWIKPDNSLLVAVENDDILAVGCVTDQGEITLNYVSPDARFCRVSTALLGSREASHRRRQRGVHTSEHPACA